MKNKKLLWIAALSSILLLSGCTNSNDSSSSSSTANTTQKKASSSASSDGTTGKKVNKSASYIYNEDIVYSGITSTRMTYTKDTTVNDHTFRLQTVSDINMEKGISYNESTVDLANAKKAYPKDKEFKNFNEKYYKTHAYVDLYTTYLQDNYKHTDGWYDVGDTMSGTMMELKVDLEDHHNPFFFEGLIKDCDVETNNLGGYSLVYDGDASHVFTTADKKLGTYFGTQFLTGFSKYTPEHARIVLSVDKEGVLTSIYENFKFEANDAKYNITYKFDHMNEYNDLKVPSDVKDNAQSE